ncbi:hypothetical protein H0H87_002406 [Tephrocybe sp. NHM501043]|nr:hypothetical protein H0H87_002406 [Tephrocybe sp. NHM501043]
MLSYVELYNPQYFLLENVIGLLKYRLMSTRSKTKRSLVGGIEAGMVKFIMRTLIALGYQVRCKVLQAGQYGAPQSRRRAIFWGAKRGVTIPDYPLPMYAFERGMNRFKFATFTMEPLSRNPDDNHQVNPHLIIHATKADKKEVQERINNGIAQFSAVANKNTPPAGFAEGAEYLSEPQNRYQQWLRGKMKDGEEVEAHYTQCFSAKIVEAHPIMPAQRTLLPRQDDQGRSIFLRKTGRGFPVPMRIDQRITQYESVMDPPPESTRPRQKRVLSVREHARSQGFPDHYVFLSMDKSITKTVVNQIRQIGNAVPVPLALHLGKALGEALLKDLVKEEKKKEREGSPVV